MACYRYSNYDSDSDCEQNYCKGEKGAIGPAGPKGQKGEPGNGSGDLEFWIESAGTNAAGVRFSSFTPRDIGDIRFAAMIVDPGAGITWNRTVAASDRPQPLGFEAVDLQLGSSDGRTAFGSGSAILSGSENRTGQLRSLIIGGENNFVEGAFSVIGAGAFHRIESAPGANFTEFSGIWSGAGNEIRAGAAPAEACSASYSAIVGGLENRIRALHTGSNLNYCLIGGGNGNRIEAAAGFDNVQTAQIHVPGDLQGSIITGGVSNVISIGLEGAPDGNLHAPFCNINGGSSNTIGGSDSAGPFDWSTINGGNFNKIIDWQDELGNRGGAFHANILGGAGNTLQADYSRSLGNYNAVFPTIVERSSAGPMPATLPAYMQSVLGNHIEARNLAATVVGYYGTDTTEVPDTMIYGTGRLAVANGTARAKRMVALIGTQRNTTFPGGARGSAATVATDVFATDAAGGLATYLRFAHDIDPEVLIEPYGYLVTVGPGGLHLATSIDHVDGVTSAPVTGVVTGAQILAGNGFETDKWGQLVTEPTYLDAVFDYLPPDTVNIEEIRAFALDHDTPNVAIDLGDAGLITPELALRLNRFIHLNYAVRRKAVIPSPARTLDPAWVPVTSFGPVRVRCTGPVIAGDFVGASDVPGIGIKLDLPAADIGWRVLAVVDPGSEAVPAVVIINMLPRPRPVL